MKRNIHLLFLIFFFFSLPSFSQIKEEKPKITRILFILDASGSMEEKWEGDTRMNVAKEVLSKFVDSLKNISDLEIALRVYGHEFNKKYNNCRDTKLEVPFKPGNSEEIKTKIKKIQPNGTTLISYSLQQSANDFPEDLNSRNIIILMTDGVESCGGDPCALSMALQKNRIFLKPFIIGMGADPSFEKAFSCMGQYFDAGDVKTFKKTMSKILKQALSETTIMVRLMDDNDQPFETNVNVTFINSVTGKVEYDYVHLLQPNNKPDLMKIDAILSYDIVVNTIPKVVRKEVHLEGGKMNVINIKTPQGMLYLRDKHKEYRNLKSIIREDHKMETLNIQEQEVKEKYLVGTYDLEVLTLPRTYFKDIKIEQSKVTTVTLPSSGTLYINDNFDGYGSIYLVKSSGEHEWIYNLPFENSKTYLQMLPGKYKIVFRTKKAFSSEFTDVRYFEIKANASSHVKLFK